MHEIHIGLKKRKEKKSKRGTTDANRFVIMNFSSLIAKNYFFNISNKRNTSIQIEILVTSLILTDGFGSSVILALPLCACIIQLKCC